MYEIYCRLRDAKGCKDAEVARCAGIAKSTLSDWKNGKSNPKQDKLQKIADFFGVSVDYLMTGQDNTFSVTMAQKDIRLSNMDERLKDYSLKLADLSQEKQNLIFKMIEQLGE